MKISFKSETEVICTLDSGREKKETLSFLMTLIVGTIFIKEKKDVDLNTYWTVLQQYRPFFPSLLIAPKLL